MGLTDWFKAKAEERKQEKEVYAEAYKKERLRALKTKAARDARARTLRKPKRGGGAIGALTSIKKFGGEFGSNYGKWVDSNAR